MMKDVATPTKAKHMKYVKLIFLIALLYSGVFGFQRVQAQNANVPFQVRQDRTLRGDVLMASNNIMGLRSLTQNMNTLLNPNTPFNGTTNNGNAIYAYIDVDGDSNTFSSSSADLVDPRLGCSNIVYAGLYWSANYYLARNVAPVSFTNAFIDTDRASTGFTYTGTCLIVNNTTGVAGHFFVRNNEFTNDNSDIQFRPASSNMVVAQPQNGCGITNGAALAGNIAVVRQGGTCSDRQKVLNAQAAGAIGVVIVSANGLSPRLTGNGAQITIPSVSIGNDDLFGQDLITLLQAQTNVVNATLNTRFDEQRTGLSTTDVRTQGTADYRNILFGFTPGGGPLPVNPAYIPIQPNAGTPIDPLSHGGVIYDGYANTATNPNPRTTDNSPYLCYADVTNFVQANGYGTYTVANMKGTVGYTTRGSGTAGGWTLVVIYEDPTPQGVTRFVTTFDGFQEVLAGQTPPDTQVFPISGFQTLPEPNPVNVRFGVATLEGDRPFFDDLAIEIPTVTGNSTYVSGSGTFASLGQTGINQVGNFFDGTISTDGAITTNRNPNSQNTHGYDADLFDLGNAGNGLIANEQTQTQFRLTSFTDTFQPFLTVFSVENIIPEMRIIKEVYDPSDLSTTINDQTVQLGDRLVYRLRIENIGNEDYLPTENVIIDDDLPDNVDLVSIDNIDVTISGNEAGNLTTIPSISYTTTGIGTGAQTIQFSIPPNLLTHSEPGNPGTGELVIDFEVQLVADCESLRDVCSERIDNQAVGRFRGADSFDAVTNPQFFMTNSSGSIDPTCGTVDGLVTNFLANIPACTSDVPYCGGDLTLVAGTGYDQYVWSGPGGFSATTSVNFVSVPGRTAGIYTVVKNDLTTGCISLSEELTVIDFSNSTHPLQDDALTENNIEYFDDGSGGCNVPLAKINLCGAQNYTINTGYTTGNLTSIVWEQLTTVACFDRADNCPAITGGCDATTNWTTIPTIPLTTSLTVDPGGSSGITEAGEYRIIATFVGGCTEVFYFDVNTNDYQPETDISPMECGNDGRIAINNIASPTLQFLILPEGSTSPTTSSTFPNTDGIFPIPFQITPGRFVIYAIDTAFPNCVYETPILTVPSFNPTFTYTPTNPTCPNNTNLNGQGSIRIEVNEGLPQYEYRITGGPDNIDVTTGNGQANNGDHTFNNLLPGTYNVEVVSNRNPVPECIDSETVIIAPASDFRAEAVLIAPETCDQGAVVQINVLAGSGGPYEYGGVLANGNPSGNFQTGNQLTIPTPADPNVTYTFQVNDSSGARDCVIETSITGVLSYEPIVIDNVTVINPSCPGDNGAIRVQVSPTVAARTYTYQIVDPRDMSGTPDPTNPVIDPDPNNWVLVAEVANSPLQDITIPMPTIDPTIPYAVQVLHNNTTTPTDPPICRVFDGTTDANGDANPVPHTFTIPIAIIADVTLNRPLSCTATPNAQIRIANVQGGSSTYEYSLDNINFTAITGANTDIDVTADGDYTVYIRNQATDDCTVNFPINVPEIVPITSIGFTNGISNCPNQTTVVTVAAVPTLTGTDFYEYQVVPNPVSGTAAFDPTTTYTLTQGVTYTFTARRNSDQCTFSQDYNVTPIPQIQIQNPQVLQNVTCMGGNDGEFIFSVDTAIFTSFDYAIFESADLVNPIHTGSSTTSPVALNNTMIRPVGGGGAGIIADTYTIVITDTTTGRPIDPTTASDRCTSTETVTITQPTNAILFTPELVQTCTDNTVTVTGVSGGTGSDYEYTLTHPTNPTLGPQSIALPFIGVPNDLADYTIVVTDAVGCPSAPQTLPIRALPGVNATINTSELCLDDNIATLTIDIAGGTTNATTGYSYSITRDGTAVVGDTDLPVGDTSFTTPDLIQAGAYVITVTDAVGCFDTINQTIAPAVAITATKGKDITCTAPTAGEINYTIADGYANYDVTYSFDDGTTTTTGNVIVTNSAATTGSFTPPAAGNYILQVTDAEACTHQSALINITASVAPTITAPDVNLDCDGDTGTVTVTVVGTDPTYEIAISAVNTALPGAPTFVAMTSTIANFPNLGEGTYEYLIRDSKGCTYPDLGPGSVDVITPDPITEASRIETPVTCGGSLVVTDLGAIDFAINDRDMPPLTYTYTYTLIEASDLFVVPLNPAPTAATTPNPATGQGNSVRFEGLDFGQYYIIAEDQNGCTETFGLFNIFSPPTDLVQNIVVTGNCTDGVTFDIDVQGGAGVDGTVDGFGSPPGFDIRIVGEPSPGLGDFVPLNDDPLNVTVENVTTPIRIHQYTGLEFNRTYILEVRDNATNCLYQELVPAELPPSSPLILGPPPALGPDPVVTDVSCNGNTDGSIAFRISAYDATVTEVDWEVFDAITNVSEGPAYAGSQGGLTGADVPVSLTALPPGSYYVLVTEVDGTQCPSRYDFLIDRPDAIDAIIDTQTPANCNQNAEVIITTSGGTPENPIPANQDGYTYVLVADGDPQPDPTIAANYPLTNVIDIGNTDSEAQDIYVRDANGCTFGPIGVTTVVTPSPTFTATPYAATNACALNNFTVITTVTDGVVNGNGNLFYGIDDGTNPVSFVEDVPGGHTFTLPTAGTYDLIVRDANGCDDTETVTIAPRIEITAAFTTVPTCNDGDGVIQSTLVSPGSGAANHTYTIAGVNGTTLPVAPLITEDPVNSGRFINVPPGDYEITVTDSGMGAPAPGCTFTTGVALPEPIDPVLEATGGTDPNCSGTATGSIVASLTTASTDPSATYTYELITGPVVRAVQSSPTFSLLPENTVADPVYTVRVTSTTGTVPNQVVCIDVQDYILTDPDPILAVAAETESYSCVANTVTLPEITIGIVDALAIPALNGIEGGTPPYRISYQTPSGTPVSDVVTDITPPIQYTFTAGEGGLYTNIVITDANNCTFPVNNVPIALFSPITGASIVTPILARATCTGPEQVRVAVQGGTGPFTFQRVDNLGNPIGSLPTATTATTADFTLPNPTPLGVYTFRITDDATTCFVEVTHEVFAYDTINVVAEQEIGNNCGGAADGRIRIDVTEYTGNLDYTIINPVTGLEVGGGTIPSATGSVNVPTNPTNDLVLPFTATAGNYIVRVVETGTPFCTEDSNVVTIDGPPVPLRVTITDINLQETCDPGSDGAFQASVTGALPSGTVTYRLSLTSSPTVFIGPVNTTGLFEGLSAENYTVTAFDDNGTFICEDTATRTIASPADDVVIPAIPDSNVTCYEAQDAIITAIGVTGSNPPFRYAITSLSTGTTSTPTLTNSFGPLGSGQYTVTVVDNLGCSATTPLFNITEPDEVTVSVDSATPVTCATSTRDVTISGVTTAAGGIVEYFMIDVTDPNPSNHTTTSNGNDPFFPGLTVSPGLTQGDYVFFVEDADGCRSDLSGGVSVIPIPNVEITLDERFAFLSCHYDPTATMPNAPNAVINANVIGGQGAYTFMLDRTSLDGSTTDPTITQADSEFRDLLPGNYTYTVTTAGVGCMDQKTFTITNPPIFDAMITPVDVTCDGFDDGSITVEASGGTPPYTFAINNEEFLSDASDSNIAPEGIVNGHIFRDLTPGMYTVLAQDSNGCTIIDDTIEIREPDPLMVELDRNITPNPEPETCAGDNDGAFTIAITGGTPPYETNITNNDADFVQDRLNYPNLPGGTTIVFIRDANGCRTELAVDITPGVRIEATLEDRKDCPIVDPITGAVTQPLMYYVDFVLSENSVDTDLIYELTGINGTITPVQDLSTPSTFIVQPGEYEGRILHGLGCEEIVGTITVEEYVPLSTPVAVMTGNVSDPNEYAINVTGGVATAANPYIYFAFQGEDGVDPLSTYEAVLQGDGTYVLQNSSTQELVANPLEDNIFLVRETDDYTIWVVDATGCSVVAVQDITYINIRIPNYFRPNDPNSSVEERFWYPRQITPDANDPFFFENMEVKVFDRYGRLLEEFKGDQQGWDGIYQGKELPSGDYWFTIILNDAENKEFTGHFTLYR